MAKTRKKRSSTSGAGAASAAHAEFTIADPPAPAFRDGLAGVLNEGIRLHQAGDFAAAEARYREALALAPDTPHALHLLGVLHHQKGENEAAAELIGRALESLPDFADAQSNMGAVMNALGRKEAALEHFRRAAELKPGIAEPHSNVAAVLSDLGRVDEAAESYRRAHEASPGTPRFVSRLGELYLAHDQFADAVDWLNRAVSMSPDSYELHNNLAFAHEKLDRVEDAERHYRRAAELRPESPEINNNLATILTRMGRMDEADVYFKRAMEAGSESWGDLSHLAGTYFNRREYGRALEVYRQLLEQQPDDHGIWNDYGTTLRMIGRRDEAEAALLRAIELKPDFYQAYDSLGMLRMIGNRRPEAIADFKKSIALAPDRYEPYLNLCITLSHENRHDEASIYAHTAIAFPDLPDNRIAHPNKVFHLTCDFDGVEQLGDPWENLKKMQGSDFAHVLLEVLPHAETAEHNAALAGWHVKWYENVVRRGIEEPLPPIEPSKGGGKLRLGILSSDLRAHSVARFVLPLLENYDRDNFEIYCYAPYESEGDKVQARIKSLVSGFRIVANRTDREFAQTIRDDRIDILFELNGFTKDSKLKVMGYRAAPVQVYWLGYPFTTGVKEVDYIVLDPNYRPQNEDWLVEAPLMMPETFCCMERLENEPVSVVPPVVRNGGMVTFGSMNNPYKTTRKAVETWARVMQETPNSRFLVVRPECSSMIYCSNLTKEFGRHGVTADRLYFVDNHAHKLSHFSYYEEIDISLDTFPLTGGTTTCDSVLMSVPVVSLVGPGLHQRLSNSILHSAGLQELCVHDVDAYVRTAVDLAQNVDALEFLRRNLRPTVLDSPLCDGAAFARNLEENLLNIAERHGLR
jgi:predicted O-linked N-acetylglucosamine transferase (SPINDLY family)